MSESFNHLLRAQFEAILSKLARAKDGSSVTLTWEEAVALDIELAQRPTRSQHEAVRNRVVQEKADAWEEGWSAHFHQADTQRRDPSHAIKRDNPYRSES